MKKQLVNIFTNRYLTLLMALPFVVSLPSVFMALGIYAKAGFLTISFSMAGLILAIMFYIMLYKNLCTINKEEIPKYSIGLALYTIIFFSIWISTKELPHFYFIKSAEKSVKMRETLKDNEKSNSIFTYKKDNNE